MSSAMPREGARERRGEGGMFRLFFWAGQSCDDDGVRPNYQIYSSWS